MRLTYSTLMLLRQVVFICALSLCPALQAQPSSSAGQENLVFAVSRGALSLPIYVAELEGFFVDEKVQVQIEDCATGRACLQQLIGGQAQLATAADVPIVLAAYEQTDKFAILATIGVTRSNIKFITRKSSGIRSVTELKGKRVGTFLRTSAHYFVEAALLVAQVDPNQVNLVNVAPDSISSSLLKNEIDVAAVFDLQALAATRALGDDAWQLKDHRIYPQTWNVVTSLPLTNARQAQLEAVLRALDRAERLIKNNSVKAQALLQRRLNLDQQAVAWLWPDQLFQLSLEQSLLSTMESASRWASRNGYVTGKHPNALKLVLPELLAKVRPDAVTIVR